MPWTANHLHDTFVTVFVLDDLADTIQALPLDTQLDVRFHSDFDLKHDPVRGVTL